MAGDLTVRRRASTLAHFSSLTLDAITESHLLRLLHSKLFNLYRAVSGCDHSEQNSYEAQAETHVDYAPLASVR